MYQQPSLNIVPISHSFTSKVTYKAKIDKTLSFD